jgi:hypothetical protein
MALRFPNLQTPIGSLLQNLENCPFSIAPERKEELEKFITENKVTGEVNLDEGRFDFSAFVMRRRIYLSSPAMERIWAYCLGTSFVYLHWQLSNFTQAASFESSDLGRRIRELLVAATASESKQEVMVWPNEAPKPDERDDLQIVPLANEMFWGVLGFIQLHEFGHIALTHITNQETESNVLIEQEFEADEWAFAWVMSKWREYESINGRNDPKVYTKRSLLLANALGILACVRFYVPAKGSRITHPNPIDRLIVFLTKWANEDNGVPNIFAWATAVTTINLHLSNDPSLSPNQRFESFRDYLYGVRERLAHRGIAEEVT